jgi:hypothetical protein
LAGLVFNSKPVKGDVINLTLNQFREISHQLNQLREISNQLNTKPAKGDK